MAKIMLFDGTNTDMWKKTDGSPCRWHIESDGSMTMNFEDRGDIVSTVTYKDAHIHVEWMEPDTPDVEYGYRGNSGVYIHGCYEIQILDSFGIEKPTCYDCGGIYTMYAPLSNVCKAPLEWQFLDVFFRAPRYNEKGERTEAARATILMNGVCVQNNIILHKATPGGIFENPVAEGPLMLQDHKSPVKFRNIWIETL